MLDLGIELEIKQVVLPHGTTALESTDIENRLMDMVGGEGREEG